MKKSHQIFFVGFVVTLFVVVGIVVFFIEGRDMRTSHYIRLELNPKIEFLTDNDNIVNSYYPINDDAKIVVAGEELVGLDINDAVKLFIDKCARLGYIDVDGNNNGVQISVSSGFTQKLENSIYEACNKYFEENEIYCVIAESDADLALYKEKKEKQVSSIEKLVVIKAILEKTEAYTFDELAGKTESELLKILEEQHELIKGEIEAKFGDMLDDKMDRLGQYLEKFDKHKSRITDESRRMFASNYSKYKKSETMKYEKDFAKKLEENND